MCATCGCGQKDKKHPKFGKGPKAKGKDAEKKEPKKGEKGETKKQERLENLKAKKK